MSACIQYFYKPIRKTLDALSLEPTGSVVPFIGFSVRKVGRGHVCNNDPNLGKSRSNSSGTSRHVAIGKRSMLLALCPTLWRLHLFSFIPSLCSYIVFRSTFTSRNLSHLLTRDLTLQAALARTSAILASKNTPKPTPAKKQRGKKAKSA